VIYVERPAAGDAEGAFVLVHGRGANEHDLFGLFDALDPERRLHGYSPRGPLPVPPGGAQWYVVQRVGYPEPASFAEGYAALSEFVDSLPHERIVLGGFSQGAVMSFAVGLGKGRPRPAAILAFSGFVPTVEGWELDAARPFPPIALAHGTYDAIIPVEHAHRSLAQLQAAGAEVLYRESPVDHAIDPAFVLELQSFLSSVTASSSAANSSNPRSR
jgi:phospholipase/carboxylesterase